MNRTYEGKINCTLPAIEDFPRDIFTLKERQQGAIIFHLATSLYLFASLAIVCDKYFVPAVERICKALNMSCDVAGATFMAAATSAPELFVNVIGTFITEGDIGVGTIVGSAVFNILAIAACCGICAITVVPLHWWPLTRDCIAYGITVVILIFIMHDERIDWYEALVLVVTYIFYIAAMYWDKPIQRYICGTTKTKTNDLQPNDEPFIDHILNSIDSGKKDCGNIDTKPNGTLSKSTDQNNEERDADEGILMQLGYPKALTSCQIALWLLVVPIYTLFLFTIPDCRRSRWKNWFPLTFVMCVVWIGSLSYIIAWMITIVGDTLRIPDSVMGITFLAAGTSVPEAVSSVIVAKQGYGSMGISNSLGSNTFDILLCLGLPWLIKAAFLPASKGRYYVEINSRGLEYCAISLLSTLLLLYAAFAVNKFKLDKKVGWACLLMYTIFLLTATLTELNFFFQVNLPTCEH